MGKRIQGDRCRALLVGVQDLDPEALGEALRSKNHDSSHSEDSSTRR